MAYEKGQSGNPGGRPRKTEQQIRFEQRCRDWSDLNLFNYLAKHADSKDKDVFKWAISELANRAFGRPVETQVLDASVTSPAGIGFEEFRASVAALIGSAKAGSKPAGSPSELDPGK